MMNKILYWNIVLEFAKIKTIVVIFTACEGKHCVILSPVILGLSVNFVR